MSLFECNSILEAFLKVKVIKPMNLLLTLVTFLTAISHITSLPNGAPETVCSTMMPFHSDISPSSSISPFRVEPSSTFISQGQRLRINIFGVPEGLNFGGFMIQARNYDILHQIVGKFILLPESPAKLLNCKNVNNSATHYNPEPKSIISLEWESPIDFLGQIVFNSTVAQNYNTFWVGVQSVPVHIVNRKTVNTVIGISTTRSPFSSTKKTYIPQQAVDVPLEVVSDPFYTNCSRSKTCFGYPDGCLQSESCNVMAAVIVRGDRYEFELKTLSKQARYVALGISSDRKMGDDLVTECVVQGDRVAVYTSLTSGNPDYGTTRLGVPQNTARLLKSSLEDNNIYCRVQRDIVTTVQDKMFDLMNNKYYLLLAYGSSVKENGVGYHDIGRIVSTNLISLSEVQDIYGSSKALLRIHGAFMITAWIGTTSLGILIARYFKQTWIGSQTCGKDEWFAWHRICMIATWSLTVSAFVIIFVEIGGWSGGQNAHAIFGTVTSSLCFIQPIGAFFRPDPNARNRPIFNWLHWLGGNMAHIFGLITIFFAVKLTKAELPLWLDWILVSYVLVHFMTHLIFSVAACISDQQRSKRVDSFQLGDMSNTRIALKTEREKTAPFENFRKSLLIIYIVLLTLFVVTLDVIVCLAPIDRTYSELKNKWIK